MGEMKRNHEIASTVYNPSAKRDDAPDQGLPMAIRYRRLSAQVKLRTYVFKSMIQGWGLNAKTNITKGDMVIEYVGEVVRKQVSDCREAYYNSKGMGIYMFGIANTDYVVDATMRGNSARFINHGCDPNCESKLIIIEGQPHIIIFALRDIEQFEELIYDYKFELDEADKVQCGCGAEKCLGWMN
jgi:SET domain-containing protein